MNDEKHILIIITLLVVLVFALVVNYIIYKRQEAAQQRRLQVRKIQGMLPDLLECLSVLKQTQCSPSITQLLESYASELLEKMAQLSASPRLMDEIQDSRMSSESPSNSSIIQPKQVQQAVNKTMTVVQILQKKNKITLQQLMQYTVELKTTNLFFDIESLLSLSERAIAENKHAAAKSSLRSAKGMLYKIPDNDPRKEKSNSRTDKMLRDLEPTETISTEAVKPSV